MDTKNADAVELEVQSAYLAMFPDADPGFVPRTFSWAKECFKGRFNDYQPVDAPYHDFEHTLQGTLCMARLLRGRHLSNAQPRIPQRIVQLGLIAILLHDTGYLKKRSDNEGTGAKYTVTHVDRSAGFAADLLAEKGFSQDDIRAVQNMIHCTGVDCSLGNVPFQTEAERLTGYALGTADLLGQMAAADYVEKLPILYGEFAEAARFANDDRHFVASYTSAEDLMRKTPAFWENFVQRKLNEDFGGLYKYLSHPYPDGPNEYLLRVEANIARLKEQLARTTV